jgi:hypothetical protein
LGRTVKLITGSSLLILVTVIVLPQLAMSGRPGPWWARLLAPAIVVSVFGVISLFSVRGFTVKRRELWVQRPLWQTRLPLHDLKAAHVDPTAMKSSWRSAGNGGLLAFTGWFRNKKLGRYRAFVTDQDRCVVMEFKDHNLVVSPDDPEGFVKALGVESDSNRNQR